MTRQGIIDALDGTHPRWGNTFALGISGLILLSAVAIALETIPGLPPEIRRALWVFEVGVLVLFCAEYILRVLCSPSPLRYIFSFWGLVDLLACVPAIALLQPQWQVFRTLRLLRLVRLLKLFRHSLALERLSAALSLVKYELIVFGILASLMLYVSAVGIYLFEHEAQPEAFTSIPKSLWWAVASFTTVGYGDMFPITTGGRIFTSFVLFIGLGIVAVPSAIITTALIETQTTVRPRNTRKSKSTKGEKHET